MNDDEKLENLDFKSNESEVLNAVKKRARQRARRYSLNDLNQLRNLPSYRKIPTNLEVDLSTIPELISPGLGLKINCRSSLSSQIVFRKKQIEIAKKSIPGYKNYVKLIPQNERLPKIHPKTPTQDEIVTFSKRRFESKLNEYKRKLHDFDNVTNINDLPYNLLTNKQKQFKANSSISTVNNKHNKNIKWSPKTSTKKTISHSKAIPHTDGLLMQKRERKYKISTSIRQKLVFDDNQMYTKPDIVYSPTKHKWFAPKHQLKNITPSQPTNIPIASTEKTSIPHISFINSASYESENRFEENVNNKKEENEMISVLSATECLKECIKNMKMLENNNKPNLNKTLLEQFHERLVQYSSNSNGK